MSAEAETNDVEPGAAPESMLIISESSENLQNMSSSLDEIKKMQPDNQDENINNVDPDDYDDISCNTIATGDDYIKDNDWLGKSKHIFVLSSAGKPIYSRYGNEDKFASYFGVMQALVSFVQADNDSLKSIHVGNTKFVFLFKEPLILVSISKTGESVSQLTAQLNYVFNEIVSMLTLSRLSQIYQQRRNYDLRRLLAGVERLIDSLLDFSDSEPSFTLGAVKCLPLAASIRDTISSAIVQSCSKIKDLVFAILLANNNLITLVRMKKYYIHPADLHLIFNLVRASESLKSAESWTPLCLPRFDSGGFLYGHVSYLSEDCQACLLLLTVDREAFFTLSEAKQKIVEKLRRANCLEGINESLNVREETCAETGFPELRHYLYKCKSTAQFYQPGVGAPYMSDYGRLLTLYRRAHQRLHSTSRPLKLLYEKSSDEVLLAWDTKGFELYVVLEPSTDKSATIALIGKLLTWIKKQEDRLFHLNAPTF
ncbi:vacuolar fusion protein MON1 homolog A [Agrilus planipennis]|uniref:Vacuolar fusion protein MON1 homolog n=1 Tax=Agrilus planipennis TaxID=224129 RepID=A0A1W4WY10_AGRPL|nr:vacuolar fusion protein MON1 homolog A [Agrilus planipennis]